MLAKTGVIKGMSFGFEVLKDTWTDAKGRAASPQQGTHRTVREVRLHEVTTTAFRHTRRASSRRATSSRQPGRSPGRRARRLRPRGVRRGREDRRDAEWAELYAAALRAEDAVELTGTKLREYIRTAYGA